MEKEVLTAKTPRSPSFFIEEKMKTFDAKRGRNRRGREEVFRHELLELHEWGKRF